MFSSAAMDLFPKKCPAPVSALVLSSGSDCQGFMEGGGLALMG